MRCEVVFEAVAVDVMPGTLRLTAICQTHGVPVGVINGVASVQCAGGRVEEIAEASVAKMEIMLAEVRALQNRSDLR